MKAGIFSQNTRCRLRGFNTTMDLTVSLLTIVLLCFGAYLLGSILFAVPVCRVCDLPDPRAQGSGNPGATNVYRAGGWQPALATLALDALKVWLPVWLAHLAGMSILVQAMVALCAVTGHMIPVFFRFKGGKGVATALGAGLALAPLTTVIMAGIWLVIMWRWRISALTSLVAIGCGPVISAILEPETLPD